MDIEDELELELEPDKEKDTAMETTEASASESEVSPWVYLSPDVFSEVAWQLFQLTEWRIESVDSDSEEDFKVFLVAERCRAGKVCKTWQQSLKVSRAITAALPLVDCTIRLPRYREFSFVQSKYKAAIDFTQNRKVILADITRAFPTEKPIRMPSLHWDGHLWRSLVLHLYLSGTTIYSSILPCFPNVTALDLSYKRGKFFDKDDINTIVSQLRWLKLESTDCVDDNSLSQLTNLQHLDLKYNSKITKRSVSWLTGLTSLNLSYNHNVKDNVVVHFTKLQSLWLDSNGTVTDAAVSTLTSLTLLDLQYNENITDKSVAMLTDLVSLNLENNNQISQEVVKRLPRLKRIRVKHNSRISPDQLLKALKELK